MIATRCICPEEIRKINRQAKTIAIWDDPEYRATVAEFLEENPVCEYCGKPSQTAHHDQSWMYKDRSEYYKKENMTPTCNRCHQQYRRGLVICPTCREHYITKASDQCQWCKGIMLQSKNTGAWYVYHYRNRHPCAHRGKRQVCSVHVICAYSVKRARECREFSERKEEEKVNGE